MQICVEKSVMHAFDKLIAMKTNHRLLPFTRIPSCISGYRLNPNFEIRISSQKEHPNMPTRADHLLWLAQIFHW